MTSTCSQSASAVTSPTASAKPPKSADSTDGEVLSMEAEPRGRRGSVTTGLPQDPPLLQAHAAVPVGRRHGLLAGRLDLQQSEPARAAFHDVVTVHPDGPRGR